MALSLAINAYGLSDQLKAIPFNMSKTRLLITGATGYIGKHLVQTALSGGCEVTVLVRRRLQIFDRPGILAFEYDLKSPPPAEAFIGIHAVIHLAVITDPGVLDSQEIELEAACSLLGTSRQAGVSNFIFVSSQSTRPDAPTLYGQTKWCIEEEVRRQGGTVVRPGLVVGGRREEALFGKLCHLAKTFPVLPAFFPSPQVQPIHVEDLCEGLLTLASGSTPPLPIFYLAQRKSISITKFLKTLAWERYRQYRLAVPIPLALLRWFARIKKHVSILPGIDLERINGLLALPKMDTDESLRNLNLELRCLVAGLNPVGNRRRILEEGNAFVCYIAEIPSGSFILRHYVRAVEALRGGKSLGLRYLFLKHPSTLRLVDPKRPVWILRDDDRKDLTWHMNTLVAFLETSPRNVRLFNLFEPIGFFSAVISLAFDAIKEIFFISLSLVLRLLAKLGVAGYARVKNAF